MTGSAPRARGVPGRGQGAEDNPGQAGALVSACSLDFWIRGK
jgi:hypothetical protein